MRIGLCLVIFWREVEYSSILCCRIHAAGQPEDFLSSGFTAEEAAQLWDLPDGLRLFEYLGGLSAPLRLADLLEHLSSLGFPDHLPPFAVGPGFSYLSAPILYQGRRVGNIYLGQKKAGEGFTEADEETLVLFASQAAMVLSNARSYREEQRARNDLKTLINTAPVG